MKIEKYFPTWNDLNPEQKDVLSKTAFRKKVKKGEFLYRDSNYCIGPMIIISGQLRAYINSEEGREVTIYRLFNKDICLSSSSSSIDGISWYVTVSAEKDGEVWVIPQETYMDLVTESVQFLNYINTVMANRLMEIMSLVEQITWRSFDKRLASFLHEESIIEKSNVIKITHEKIANHMGSAREVVTRMLRYFQDEGIVRLSREYMKKSL